MEYTTSSNAAAETEQTTENEIPVVCAWCQPYVEGSTSTICPDCLAKYFPEKKG